MDELTIRNRISKLLVRQAVYPTNNERLILRLITQGAAFHSPIPSNQYLRLIPRNRDLVSELQSQANDFSLLNKCCYTLFQCTFEFVRHSGLISDAIIYEIIHSWRESIDSHLYYKSLGYYQQFISRLASFSLAENTHYSPFLYLIDGLPNRLLYSWQLSFSFPLNHLDKFFIFPKLIDFNRKSSLLYLEIPASECSAKYVSLTLYFHQDLSFADLIEFICLVEKEFKLNCVQAFRSANDYCLNLTPHTRLQRGGNGIKHLLLISSRLHHLYSSESKFSLSVDDNNLSQI